MVLGLIYDNSKEKDVLCLLQHQHDDLPRRAGHVWYVLKNVWGGRENHFEFVEPTPFLIPRKLSFLGIEGVLIPQKTFHEFSS